MADGKISRALALKCLDEYSNMRGKRWKLDARLGTGGFATVFRVTHEKTTVAAKIARLKPCKRRSCDVPGAEKDAYGICCHEIEMMRHVGEHPNIMKMYDSELLEIIEDEKKGVTLDTEPFALMLMPECTDLYELARKKRGLTEEDLRQIAIDMCKALEHCAARFVFHCDLKSENIFAEQKCGKLNYVLGDFGVATIVNPYVEKPQLFGYTPEYVAPEIAYLCSKKPKHEDPVLAAAGDKAKPVKYDPKLVNADVFSLGATLYNMMSWELPDPMVKLGLKERSLLKISPAFEDIICKAVQYDPHDRYASAADMRKDLERLTVSHETIVFEFSQFFQAKEYLLDGKLDRAAVIAESGVEAGEPRCELLLAYIHCIRVCQQKQEEGWELDTYRAKLQPVINEMNHVYEKYKLPMAQFLSGIMYEELAFHSHFTRNMELAARKNCVPAIFFWGRILDFEDYGHKGRQAEGRALIHRAAEMEYQPALRHVRRYHEKKYAHEFSDVLWRLLSSVDKDDPPMVFEGAVKYL